MKLSLLLITILGLGLMTAWSLHTVNAQGNNSTNYTFNMELKKPKFSLGGLSSEYYDVKNIETNVTDLIGSNIAKTLGSPVSISESQVFLNFDLKVPESPDSKKSVLEKSSFFLSVASIEEKDKRSKTYELEPQQYSNAEIGGHKVLGGTADLQGNKGTLHLILEP